MSSSTSTASMIVKEMASLVLSSTAHPSFLRKSPLDDVENGLSAILLSIDTSLTQKMTTAKKRSANNISATPAEFSAEDSSLAAGKASVDAVKKAKTAEVDDKALHQTEKPSSNDEATEAMEMDMGDSDAEEFVSKDDVGLDAEKLAELEADRKLMEEMGFPTSFGSTKGKHVEGNDIYASHKIKVRKVRQLINKKVRPKGAGRPPPKS